jgi:hypothetical protein
MKRMSPTGRAPQQVAAGQRSSPDTLSRKPFLPLSYPATHQQAAE